MNKVTISFLSLAFAFAATSCVTETPKGECPKSECAATAECGIVYLNIDELMATSDLFAAEGVTLQERTEKKRSEWARKEQALQQEATKLQEKYQKGLITTSNAQKEQQSIEQKVAAFQRTVQGEAQSLDEENSVFANRMQDLVRRSVEAVNSDKKYKMIVNASVLIDADTTLNITPLVLEQFNALYAKEK